MCRLFAISILIIAALCIISTNLFAEGEILKIAAQTGKVLVIISPATEWTEATIGRTLNPKDRIKTEANSKVTLEFPDKSTISLKPNTEIAIEELVWDNTAKKVGIDMSSGELKAIIKKLDTPSEFKVKTPTAVCGARGTIFYVIVFEDGTGVYVEEGLVDFLNTLSGETYTVYQGMNSESHSDGTTTEPQQLSKEQVDNIISGWDVGPVAEPYTEPAGDTGPTAGDVVAPEATQEGQASRI